MLIESTFTIESIIFLSKNTLTCLYDVFNSGDEVDDRDDNDDRKSSDPSTETNIYEQQQQRFDEVNILVFGSLHNKVSVEKKNPCYDMHD